MLVCLVDIMLINMHEALSLDVPMSQPHTAVPQTKVKVVPNVKAIGC